MTAKDSADVNFRPGRYTQGFGGGAFPGVEFHTLLEPGFFAYSDAQFLGNRRGPFENRSAVPFNEGSFEGTNSISLEL